MTATSSRTTSLRPFQEFTQTGAASGLVLLACAAVALLIANSPWSAPFHEFWETPLSIGLAARPLTLSVHHWVNDGLMAVFFLLVGLEIKRELLVGELSLPRHAALPIVAAIGGMVVPVALYLLINPGGPEARGWAVPMATDIAFALGLLAVFAPRAPVALKVFLTALAIVDDLGAVIVIGVFYTSALDFWSLGVASLAVALLIGLNVRRVTPLVPYLVLGVVLWYALSRSGVHTTLAGIVVAMCVPATARANALEFSTRARLLLDDFDRAETGDLMVITSKGQQEALDALDIAASHVNSALLRLEHSLHRVVAFGIMPVFALANAGVHLGGEQALSAPVVAGVTIGLVGGKAIGVMGFSWLAVRLRVIALPPTLTWRHVFAGACLAGVGFTMSLFIAALAFGDARLQDSAKAGTLLASVIAGTVAYVVLRKTPVGEKQ